jgi:quinol monooxygenase YgiN
MSQRRVQLPQPAPGETGPYAVIVTSHAKPECAEALKSHLLTLLEATNKELGAIAVNLHRDRFNPNIFVLYEVWRDVAALEKHLTQPHAIAYQSVAADYLAQERIISWLITESIRL